MSSPIESKLKDIGCSFLSGYAFKSSDYSTSGIPLIKIGNIQNRLVEIAETGDFVSPVIVDEKVSKYFLEDKDVLIAMTGQGSVGRVGRLRLRNSIKPLLNQRVGKFLCDEKNINIDYLFYVLSSDKYQDLLFNTGAGSGQPNLSPDLILDVEIPAPEYLTQTAIAEILTSLDDKIDLLHRQNKTLEQLAETLFRQWFVEEADESWELKKVDDVISVKGGTTPSTKNSEYWDGEIHWTSPRDLSNSTSIFLFDTERKITNEGLAQISSGLLPVGTVLMSSRAPIGYLTLTEIPVAINQGYIGIICDKYASNYFMFLWCKENMDTIENAGNGSVFQEISKSAFRSLDFTVPPSEKLKQFDKKVEPMFQKMKLNTIQIRTLTKLRDTLLPKLMSGEARVK